MGRIQSKSASQPLSWSDKCNKVKQRSEINRHDKTAKLSPHFLLPIKSAAKLESTGPLQTNTEFSVTAAAQSFYSLAWNGNLTTNGKKQRICFEIQMKKINICCRVFLFAPTELRYLHGGRVQLWGGRRPRRTATAPQQPTNRNIAAVLRNSWKKKHNKRKQKKTNKQTILTICHGATRCCWTKRIAAL